MRSVDLNCDCGEGFGAYPDRRRQRHARYRHERQCRLRISCRRSGDHGKDFQGGEGQGGSNRSASWISRSLGVRPPRIAVHGGRNRAARRLSDRRRERACRLCGGEARLREGSWRPEQYRGGGRNDRAGHCARGQNGRSGPRIARARPNEIGNGGSRARSLRSPAKSTPIAPIRTPAFSSKGRAPARCCTTPGRPPSAFSPWFWKEQSSQSPASASLPASIASVSTAIARMRSPWRRRCARALSKPGSRSRLSRPFKEAPA